MAFAIQITSDSLQSQMDRMEDAIQLLQDQMDRIEAFVVQSSVSMDMIREKMFKPAQTPEEATPKGAAHATRPIAELQRQFGIGRACKKGERDEVKKGAKKGPGDQKGLGETPETGGDPFKKGGKGSKGSVNATSSGGTEEDRERDFIRYLYE